jgi:hypothetical protein
MFTLRAVAMETDKSSQSFLMLLHFSDFQEGPVKLVEGKLSKQNENKLQLCKKFRSNIACFKKLEKLKLN